MCATAWYGLYLPRTVILGVIHDFLWNTALKYVSPLQSPIYFTSKITPAQNYSLQYILPGAMLSEVLNIDITMREKSQFEGHSNCHMGTKSHESDYHKQKGLQEQEGPREILHILHLSVQCWCSW